MYEILEKKILNPTVHKMVVSAPLVAKKAQPGQSPLADAAELHPCHRRPVSVGGRRAGHAFCVHTGKV